MIFGTITACAESGNEMYTVNTKIADVIADPVFKDYGRLIFPVHSGYYNGDTLGSLHLTWYNYINPEKTVEIANYFKKNAQAGNKIFYDIYTDEEKAADPQKNNTGLFLFRGNKNGKVAICNAGGGFAYVGAMQESFPHALELSKKGYNAFALIYRPGADTATEDLARAISFIHENADELEVDVTDYSLWGGSAGARMAAWLGSNGTESYGEKAYPRPAAVIMQYTGHTEVTGDEPPTYNCVGTNDGIASYITMENRINKIKANGTDTMIEVLDGLPHGFGIGENTVAEGWLDNAVGFWERNMKNIPEKALITVNKPIVENGKIKFSINSDADLKNIYLITALYEDKILQAVNVNETNGEFPILPDKNYMIKVFAWEKGTLRPLTQCFSFDNLKADS